VTTFAVEQEKSAEYVLKIISHARVKQNIIYGNRAVCKIRGKPQQNNAKPKRPVGTLGVDARDRRSRRTPRKFVYLSRHVMCRLSGPRPLKTISEPLVRVTFISLSSRFQKSAAIKKIKWNCRTNMSSLSRNSPAKIK